MEPSKLEADYFRRWEEKWRESERDINNPKIPIKYVKAAGELVFVQDQTGQPTYANPEAAPPRARPKKK
jgi:hypothetical protein